jgi:hypothetical protein
MASLNESSASNWTLAAGTQFTNVWHATGFPSDVGSIFVNGTTVLTGKVSNLSSLTSQGQFYYAGNGNVYMYSTSNPAIYYSGGIEVWYKGTTASNGNIIYAKSQSYLVFQDLELKYGGGHGLQCADCDNVTAQRLTVSYIGGSYLSGTTRYGNGIEFWDNATNIVVQNNNVSQTFDEGITIQTANNNITQNNDTVKNNIIDKCGRGIAHSNTGTGGTINNILYYGNTITSPGLGYSTAVISNGQGLGALLNVSGNNTLYNMQFIGNNIENTAFGADPIGQGIEFYGGWSITGNWLINTNNTALRGIGNVGGAQATEIAYNVVDNTNGWPGIFLSSYTGLVNVYNNSIYNSVAGSSGSPLVVLGVAGYEVSDVTFKNNIVAQFSTSGTELVQKTSTNSTVTLDYNLYYRSTAGNLANWNGIEYTSAQWGSYQSASFQDAHSRTPSNPLFSNSITGTYSAAGDFMLGAGSPAIWAGANVGLTNDYAGRPVHTPPSIGAYEYPKTGRPTPPLNLRIGGQ